MGVLNSILPITAILLLGYLSKTYFIRDKSFWSNINKLVYYIMFPSLMVYSIGKADFGNIDISFVFVLIIVIIFITLMIWIVKSRFTNQDFWISFLQGSIKYNSYVFIGVTLYYLNDDVMPIVALITASMIITTNVITVFIFNTYSQKKKKLVKTLISTIKNPLILSCLMGLAVNYIANYLPYILEIIWINNTLDKIGEASLALSLIGVGASLNLSGNYDKVKGAIYSSIIKLIILPFIVLISLKFLDYDNILVIVCVIYAASPCSSNATAMTQSLGGDFESMSLIISIQTVLSMITISFWLILFQNGYI